jgi:prepilin-type N-terminal cleavage/methylation domain-containing protein
MKPSKGFTLVELMIVVAIIGTVIAIAVPSGMKAAEQSRKTVCMNNLRQINYANETWALMNNKRQGDPINVAEANELIKKIPQCPCDGTYDYGLVGGKPTCSLGATLGHILPPED